MCLYSLQFSLYFAFYFCNSIGCWFFSRPGESRNWKHCLQSFHVMFPTCKHRKLWIQYFCTEKRPKHFLCVTDTIVVSATDCFLVQPGPHLASAIVKIKPFSISSSPGIWIYCGLYFVSHVSFLRNTIWAYCRGKVNFLAVHIFPNLTAVHVSCERFRGASTGFAGAAKFQADFSLFAFMLFFGNIYPKRFSLKNVLQQYDSHARSICAIPHFFVVVVLTTKLYSRISVSIWYYKISFFVHSKY